MQQWLTKALIGACLVGSASTAFAMSQSTINDPEQQYSRQSQDKNAPLEERVEATLALANYGGPNSLIAVARATRAEEPELRIAALDASRNWSAAAKWDVASKLLNDKNLDVQLAALQSAASLTSQLNADQQGYFDTQVTAYLDATVSTASFERAELMIMQAQYSLAFEELSEKKLREQNPSRVALLQSEVLIRQGEVANATAQLEESVARLDDNTAPLYYQLGNIHTKQAQYQEALKDYSKAQSLAPDNLRYGVTVATLNQKLDPALAYKQFNALYRNTGHPQYLYSACESQILAGSDAQECVAELKQFAAPEVIDALYKSAGQK